LLVAGLNRNRHRLELLAQDLAAKLDPKLELWPALKRGTPGYWELWFGDSCHALRGLELAAEILNALPANDRDK